MSKVKINYLNSKLYKMGLLNEMGNLGKEPKLHQVKDSKLYKRAIENAKKELLAWDEDEQIVIGLKYLGFSDESILNWGDDLIEVLKIVNKSSKLTRDLRLMLKSHAGDFDKIKGMFLQLLDERCGLSDSDISKLESIIKGRINKGNNDDFFWDNDNSIYRSWKYM